jgi:hypothetical protein
VGAGSGPLQLRPFLGKLQVGPYPSFSTFSEQGLKDFNDKPHYDSVYLTSEGRIGGVCPSRFEDAPGQGKEVTALSILNLPVTLSYFSTGL